LGYVVITIGIFTGLMDKQDGLWIVVVGVMIVILGWLIIYKAYRVSKL